MRHYLCAKTKCVSRKYIFSCLHQTLKDIKCLFINKICVIKDMPRTIRRKIIKLRLFAIHYRLNNL